MPAPQVQGLNSQIVRHEPQKVFVYGTLKKGYHNHHYLEGCSFLGEGSLEGIMFHLGGFPAINLSESFHKITGEVYQCDWEHILDMDSLEGVGRNFYDRIQVRIPPYGIVWTYIFPRTRAEKEEFVVPSGTWVGADTPAVRWNGWNSGVSVGTFQTNTELSEVRIGGGNSPYYLIRSAMDNLYRITNKETGEVMGPYRYLRDMIGKDGNKKPVLVLPRRSPALPNMVQKVNEAIAKDMGIDSRSEPYIPPPKQYPPVGLPVPTNTPKIEAEKEEDIPQAARLLNLKYGAA